MTYVLIHGAGDAGWYWHIVAAQLRSRGHDVVVMDLPVDDDSAGLSDYADVVVHAIGSHENLIIVAQSFGGYVAPIVCDRVVGVMLLVLVAAMIPAPGESAEEMLVNTGYVEPKQEDSSEVAIFYHDVEPTLAAEALSRGRRQSETPGKEPWPLIRWPDVPTRYLLCRNDRIFPAPWVRRVVQERLGIVPDEIDSGHTPALSHPVELVERLESYGAYSLQPFSRGGRPMNESSATLPEADSRVKNLIRGFHGVRYQVKEVARSIDFYTQHLGFKLEHKQLPAFAAVSLEGLPLLLSGPGASGSRALPNGEHQEPGGWNRIVLRVDDLTQCIEVLKEAGLRFRNEMEAGPGGKQIQLLDPDGNPIELFEPAR